MSATDDSGARRVRSLRDLPQSIAPPEEIWKRIAAEIEVPTARAPRRRPQLLAAAAVLTALFVGVLVGRWGAPGPQRVAQQARDAGSGAHLSSPAGAVPVVLIQDPRYQQERAQLLASLSARLAALPPDTRQKVRASLANIQQSMQELQTALGRDPSNALLQELLVDTCQDEMRVLVSVNEAGQDAEQL